MSRVLLWVSFFTFSNSCNCLILIGSLCCTVKLERKEALFYVEKSIQWTTFNFSFSWWWESSVHHIRKLFNRLLAHYIFTSQAYNPHFSLYWSLKWNLSQLIVYIFSLHCKQIYIFSGNFLLMAEVVQFYICDLRKTWSCPDHQLQIKLWYIDLVHVY